MKQAPINIGEIRLRESKPRSKFVWVHKAKGNESYMYVGVVRLSETSPNKFWRNQAEGKSTQVKICLGPEGQGKLILYAYVDAVRLSKTSPNKFWRNQAEGK